MGYSEGVYDLVRAFRDPEQSLSYRFYEKDFYARWFKDPERYPVEVLREVKLAWWPGSRTRIPNAVIRNTGYSMS